MITKSVRYLFLTIALVCPSLQMFAMKNNNSSDNKPSSSKPQYPCQHCGKSYSNIGNLKNHERICKQQPDANETSSDESESPSLQGLTKSHKMTLPQKEQQKREKMALQYATLKNKHPQTPLNQAMISPEPTNTVTTNILPTLSQDNQRETLDETVTRLKRELQCLTAQQSAHPLSDLTPDDNVDSHELMGNDNFYNNLPQDDAPLRNNEIQDDLDNSWMGNTISLEELVLENENSIVPLDDYFNW